MEKSVKIISGTMPKYILEYFNSLTANNDSNKRFWTDEWEVIVGDDLNKKKGSIYIPAIEIIFKAEENICDRLLEDFRKKFMTAGG